MDDLRILMARLGWPSTATRWWTMQALATRLGNQLQTASTERALIQYLQDRKLEAEVIEVLCIFWMAAKEFGYSTSSQLTAAIPKPSMLAALMMANLGLEAKDRAEDLTQLPSKFQPSEEFGGVHGIDLPRAFLSNMTLLEHQSSRPFVKQMAFEWALNQAAYPEAAYQGDAGYFLRPMGDGFVAHLSMRTALRAISAYLRAIEVGRHFWQMPAVVARRFSLSALPIHPTLAFLRPDHPSWLRLTAFDASKGTHAIETSLRALIADVQCERPGDELIGFSSPVLMSSELCIEVSMVRWAHTDDFMINADLSEKISDFWSGDFLPSSSVDDPFSTTTSVRADSVEGMDDNAPATWPLAGFLDLTRIGYLQHDLYPTRVLVPTMSGKCSVDIAPSGGKLEGRVAGKPISELYYWNAGWNPTRPSQLGGNCGTAVISRGTTYREVPRGSKAQPTCGFYLWQARILRRENGYGQFSEELNSGVIPV